MLDNRRDPACKQSLGDRPAHRRDAFGPGREGPRADRIVHALARDIEDRRTVDGNPNLDEIMSDEAGDQARRCLRRGWVKPSFDRGRSRI